MGRQSPVKGKGRQPRPSSPLTYLALKVAPPKPAITATPPLPLPPKISGLMEAASISRAMRQSAATTHGLSDKQMVRKALARERRMSPASPRVRLRSSTPNLALELLKAQQRGDPCEMDDVAEILPVSMLISAGFKPLSTTQTRRPCLTLDLSAVCC